MSSIFRRALHGRLGILSRTLKGSVSTGRNWEKNYFKAEKRTLVKARTKKKKVNLDNNEWSRAVGLKLSASESLGEFV